MNESNEFYRSFIDLYEDLFPASQDMADLLQEHGAGGGAKVLDLGCGTGAMMQALAGRRRSEGCPADAEQEPEGERRSKSGELGVGPRLWGTDLSPEMVERARAKSVGPVAVANIRDVGSHPARPFDLIYCIGNTVAHLSSHEEVRRLLGAVAQALRPGGAAVFQFVDVAGMNVGDHFDLPTLEAGDVVFERRYTRVAGDRVRFDAWLNGSNHIQNTLLVIQTEAFARDLSDAGFVVVRIVDEGWSRVVVVRIPGTG